MVSATDPIVIAFSDQRSAQLDQAIILLLGGYALVCALSVAGANLFIDAALVVALFRLWRARQDVSMDKGVLIAVAFMVAAASLSGFFAIDSRKSVQPVWFILYHTAPMFLAMTFLRSSAQATAMILALSASLSLSAVYAVFQSTQGVMRPPGPTGDWFILAGQLSILMPFLFVLVISDSYLNKWQRGGLAVTLVLAVGALAVNGTRGAWLAVVVSGAVYAGLKIRAWRQIKLLLLFALAAVLLVAGVASSQGKAAKFMSRGMQTAVERTVIWQSSVQMIRDYPLFGVGPGNFAEQYQTRYILPQAKERKSQPHSHNNILAVWSEMGSIGLAAFLALFAYIIRHFWRQAHLTGDNSRLWAVLMATMGLQLHGLSDYTFLGFPTVIQTYWFLVGVFWNHPYHYM